MTETQYTKYGKNWYEKHKEQEIAKRKAYYEAHKEEKKAYAKEYAKKHKEKIKEYREAHKEEQKEKTRKPLGERKTRKKLVYDKPDYITVMQYPNGIVLIEATFQPDDGMIYDSTAENIDDNSNHRLKRELVMELNKVSTDERIVVVDKFSIQIYEKTLDNIQLIINTLQHFCENTLKKVAAELVF